MALVGQLSRTYSTTVILSYYKYKLPPTPPPQKKKKKKKKKQNKKKTKTKKKKKKKKKLSNKNVSGAILRPWAVKIHTTTSFWWKTGTWPSTCITGTSLLWNHNEITRIVPHCQKMYFWTCALSLIRTFTSSGLILLIQITLFKPTLDTTTEFV